jgi:hypothetical protein
MVAGSISMGMVGNGVLSFVVLALMVGCALLLARSNKALA